MADLAGLEQQRQALEDSLQKLRQSLKYWQTFDAEYEGLKEEILSTPPPVDLNKLTEISKTYDGDLVNEEVVRELAGLDKGLERTAPQVIRDIERRQEYVQKNIETIQRQFFVLESKLETFDFAATRDAETGLPLTEIEEELDDDDNVVASRLHQPEQSQHTLLDSLRKAGVTQEDLEDGTLEHPLKSAITNASPLIPSTSAVTPASENRAKSSGNLHSCTGDTAHDGDSSPRPPIRKKSVSFTADTKAPPEIVRFESEDGKKSVSFADRVAIAPAAPLPDNRTVQFSPQIEEIPPQPLGPPSPVVGAQATVSVDNEKQKDLRASFKPGDKVKTLGDDDEVIVEDVVLPEDETEEDAQTRREMLDYHLNEIGHVVAQMDLDGDDYDEDDEDEDDDTSSHFTGSVRPDDEDTPYTSAPSDDEEEDQYGRTKGKVVTGDYRREMLEMQQRLIGNMGPTPKDAEIADLDAELDAKDVRKLVIRDKRNSVSSTSSDSSEKKAAGKKRVSFAEELDVSSPPPKALKHTETEMDVPVSDTVTERPATATLPPAPQDKPVKTSRFAKARATPTTTTSPDLQTMDLEDPNDFSDTPTGPQGRILAESLIERPTPAKPSIAPSADDLDPVAERRQLAADYYRRRNEMLRQQGGFKGDKDEEELGELMEERDGKLKKVSRFKAARIKP